MRNNYFYIFAQIKNDYDRKPSRYVQGTEFLTEHGLNEHTLMVFMGPQKTNEEDI